MAGTLLNALTVLVGSVLGIWVGARLPQRIQESVLTALGLTTILVGVSNILETGNAIIPLLSLVIGVIIGEALRLDALLDALAARLQQRFGGGDSAGAGERERFINGYVTASLVFCIGPLTFLGSLLEGMGQPEGFQMLAIKSTLDGFASAAFAASFGVGVAFSVVTILLLQGGLALVGALVGQAFSDAMVNEMTAVGGLIILGISLTLLDIKKPRLANFLPALVVAPLLVAVAGALGIDVYPF